MKHFILMNLFFLTLSPNVKAQTCEEGINEMVSNASTACRTLYGPCRSDGGGAIAEVHILSTFIGSIPAITVSCKQYSCVTGDLVNGLDSQRALCPGPANPISSRPTNQSQWPTNQCGSIVQIENQIVGESVPITGTSFNMNYFSHWAQGRAGDYKTMVRIADDPVRDNIDSFDVVVKDGSTIVSSASYLNNTPDVTFSYQWDGLDALSNPMLGTKTFQVIVTENRPGISIPVESMAILGSLKSKLIGLGGWLPSSYHFYDSNSGKIYGGDGSVKSVQVKAWNTTGYMSVEDGGSQVYYFDSTGRQIMTKTGLLGTVIYNFSYDLQGRLSSIDEPFSRTTTFGRDVSGNLNSITSPNGQVTAVSLDVNGYVATFTNPQSETYGISYYGTEGLIYTFTKPAGQISTFTYDANGNISRDGHSGGYFFDLLKTLNSNSVDFSKTTKMGRETKYNVQTDDGYINKTTTYPDGRSETYNFNQGAGYASEVNSRYGYYKSSSFIDDARFGSLTNFLNSYSTYYGSANYGVTNTQSATLSDVNDPFSITAYSIASAKGSSTVSSSYNPSTKTFSTSTGLGRTSQTIIDTYERVTSQKQGGLYPVEFTYTNEHLTKIKQNTRETNLAYNPTTGFLSSITNPLTQATVFTYDGVGRVATKIFPDLRTLAYSYDANGNISGITPPGRTIHSFNLSSSELASSYAPPSLSGVTTVNTSYSYDDDKQLTQVLKPTGDSIDFSYNAVSGRLETVTTPTNTFTYTLDGTNGLPYYITATNGPVTMMTYAGTVPVQYTTYTNGWAAQISDYMSNLSANGTVSSDAVTGTTTSTINYTYDNDEALKTAGDITLTYNFPNGLLTGITMGTGTTGFSDAYTYNSFGEMATYTAKRGTTTIYTLSLGRDGMGRINSKSEFMNAITNSFAYTFDSAGRLTQTDKNSGTVATYGYDDNSNRNSGTIGAQTTTATYNNQDWMTAYNTLTFTYNANGDMLTRTNTTTSTTTTYVYDVFGNLTSVTLPGGTVITYEIDALNRRIGKKVNGVLQKRWVYMDQTRIAAELSSAGAITKRFIYGSKGNIPDYMLVGSTKYRIISDHLGSPRLVVKQSDGSITQRMNHDEYGRVTEDTNPGYLPFGFAGGLYDNQTGLVRFGARDFDSETGRWMAKDPILFNGKQTNLFGYVNNDPINFIDPKGTISATYQNCVTIATVGGAMGGWFLSPPGFGLLGAIRGGGFGGAAGLFFCPSPPDAATLPLVPPRSEPPFTPPYPIDPGQSVNKCGG